MPRTEITLNTTTRAGTAIVWTNVDSTNGMYYDNSAQRGVIHVKNVHASSTLSPTAISLKTVDGLAVGDRAMTVVAAVSGHNIYGAFNNLTYGTSADKEVQLDFDTENGSDFQIAVVIPGSATDAS